MREGRDGADWGRGREVKSGRRIVEMGGEEKKIGGGRTGKG